MELIEFFFFLFLLFFDIFALDHFKKPVNPLELLAILLRFFHRDDPWGIVVDKIQVFH
jgi:hypothetical protein